MATLYTQLQAASIPCSNHCSDLYFPVTPESTAIVREALARGDIYSKPKTFVCNVTGKLHYDATFQYEPFWNSRGMIKTTTNESKA